MVQALNLALHQEMEKDDRVIVLGEDVGVDGGVFRVTDGLIEQFGEKRSVDTPLAESGIVGMSIGMAVYGLRPVCEIQFSGFSYFSFHQIESHASRLRWRSQGRFTVPMVLRTPYGGGVRALEHHSESREAYFAHMPGIKMVIPSGPRNARALLVSAIRDPDPVVFFEGKAIYRAFREEVPGEEDKPGGDAGGNLHHHQCRAHGRWVFCSHYQLSPGVHFGNGGCYHEAGCQGEGRGRARDCPAPHDAHCPLY